MRILLVTSKYLPSVGGLETAVRELNRHLQQAGHETLIVTNRHSRKLSPREQIDGTEVRRFFFTSGLPKLTPVQLMKYPARLAAAPGALLGLRRTIAEFRPDVVNLHFVGHPTPYLLAALGGSNIPLVVSLHGEDVETDLEHSASRRKWFRQAVALARAVTSNSAYLLGRATTFAPEILERATVVGNGCTFSDAAAASVQHQRQTVLCVSRLVHKKGIDILLQAFQMLERSERTPELVLVGDGPEMAALRSLAEALGISGTVHFEGKLAGESVATLMRSADVYCLPSRKEPFGIVLLEAMSFGLPIVATAVGGVPEVLEDGRLGYLVPSENPATMADAIKQALENGPPCSPEDLMRHVRERYDWNVIASRFIEVYERAIG